MVCSQFDFTSTITGITDNALKKNEENEIPLVPSKKNHTLFSPFSCRGK